MRIRRRRRVRKKIYGTSERPRLSVYRSLKHIYAQAIDDEEGVTLVSASSLRLNGVEGTKTDVAREVGRLIAKMAKEKGISRVSFDRGCYLYHGRIKALAEGAREGGLEF
jgi:large subunit ribosomal protein L18